MPAIQARPIWFFWIASACAMSLLGACRLVKFQWRQCLGPIILSPLNSPVKMSPHEQGDIRREPERVTTSGVHFAFLEGRGGVGQSRRTPMLERAPDQALEEPNARRRGGGSGPRQSRSA